MAILLNTARHGFVFPDHVCHIPHPHNLASRGVAEYDLVSDLFLAVLLCFHVYGNVLVVIADATAHRGDALCLQPREEYLLPYAVGLQPLSVDVQ